MLAQDTLDSIQNRRHVEEFLDLGLGQDQGHGLSSTWIVI
jgi:hypothetical protein